LVEHATTGADLYGFEGVEGRLMLILQLISVSLFGFQTLPNPQQESNLPVWTENVTAANSFVVETEEFATHFAATESLVPAAKTDLISWAATNYGEDSRAVIAAIPLEDIRNLMEDEHVHKFRRDYDAETAKRLEADHDDFYVGYVLMQIDDSFHERIEQRLSQLRLKNRLGRVLVTAIFCLGFLGVFWGYLLSSKLTRGFYISRLRWLAGLCLCVILLVCYTVYQLLF
jgi:hypothetical protein